MILTEVEEVVDALALSSAGVVAIAQVFEFLDADAQTGQVERHDLVGVVLVESRLVSDPPRRAV